MAVYEAGPLVDVGTTVGGIDLDVNRQLYLGPDSTLEFMIPSGNPNDEFTILYTFYDSFDRISGDETDKGEGRSIIYQVADLVGNLAELIRHKDLHIRCQGKVYKVEDAPQPAENEAQIYTLYCQIRTAKTNFSEGRRR